MAKISAAAERVFRIDKFLGLNEAPDGDTQLRPGEAAQMRNWRVTNAGTLRRRPGTRDVACLCASPGVSFGPEVAYSTEHSSSANRYTVYPQVTLGTGGLIALSGDGTALTYSTREACAGAYMQDGDGRTWKFSRCEHDKAAQTYTWYFCRLGISAPGAVKALWSGSVGASEVLAAAANGVLWKLAPGAPFSRTNLGEIDTSGPVSLFGFGGKLYVLAPGQYKVWDGKTLSDVTGYRPVVTVASKPSGGGTALERINRLNGLRRCRFSPDGTSKAFVLPEKDLASVDWVKNLGTGMTYAAGTDYTADTADGKITFEAAPEAGTDSIEVAWTVPTTFRSQITAMKYAELYNGSTDSRVFLYGDGSNTVFYSGLENDGSPSAEYFPDENEIAVGESNTPVTSLLRHYGALIAFKTDSTWSIRYDYTTLADGTVTATFFTVPINRDIGNEAPGQAQLVLNAPRTLCAGGVYEWRNGSSYTSNLTSDERQARRISDRVANALSGFDLASCVCWDDNSAQEYYIVGGSGALVHNYAADAWYAYADFPASCFARHDGSLFIGTSDGFVRAVADRYASDNGDAIDAYWESGSMAFGAENRDKTTNELTITTNPAERGKVSVSALTNNGRTRFDIAAYVGYDGFDFSVLDFSDFPFRADVMPRAHRIKTRLRYSYLKLIFESNEAGTNASVLSALIPVYYGGSAR